MQVARKALGVDEAIQTQTEEYCSQSTHSSLGSWLPLADLWYVHVGIRDNFHECLMPHRMREYFGLLRLTAAGVLAAGRCVSKPLAHGRALCFRQGAPEDQVHSHILDDGGICESAKRASGLRINLLLGAQW